MFLWVSRGRVSLTNDYDATYEIGQLQFPEIFVPENVLVLLSCFINRLLRFTFLSELIVTYLWLMCFSVHSSFSWLQQNLNKDIWGMVKSSVSTAVCLLEVYFWFKILSKGSHRRICDFIQSARCQKWTGALSSSFIGLKSSWSTRNGGSLPRRQKLNVSTL